ncbi:BrnT family toxin [Agrobacterium rubi]|uniref:BrnT family toxin n=1 Tax=Agrobacterium rubi TaxID=28099 RepID=UPI0015720B5C|nr:BrnT family toxin [Agrobacterium rubi]NTF08023.1 BrnT family toxin [Agrobacterium rubi]NTF20251.1 BrnT family toxin [Agrobacterium rubi]NTF27222.1 BrnT family toxin [Agrobacterium rubi]
MTNEKTENISFEWDEKKRQLNIEKHKIDFEDAILALEQPRFEIRSSRNGEVRTLAICPITDRLIAVVYTMRGEKYRIISARTARKNEQQLYYDRYPR